MGNTVTIEDSNTIEESEKYEYGGWESVKDRIRRRKMKMPYFPDFDRWEYEITGEWNGEQFTGVIVILFEMIRQVSPEEINRYVRGEFFHFLSREVGKREGDWVTS
jgi:hypothetical protein